MERKHLHKKLRQASIQNQKYVRLNTWGVVQEFHLMLQTMSHLESIVFIYGTNAPQGNNDIDGRTALTFY